MWREIEQRDGISHRRFVSGPTRPRPTTHIRGISDRRGRCRAELPDRQAPVPAYLLRSSVRCEQAVVHSEFCSASAAKTAALISVPYRSPYTGQTGSSFRTRFGLTLLVQCAPVRDDSERIILNIFAGPDDGAA